MSRSDLLKSVKEWERESYDLLLADAVHKVIESASQGFGHDYGAFLFDLPEYVECDCPEVVIELSFDAYGEEWFEQRVPECFGHGRVSLPFQVEGNVNFQAYMPWDPEHVPNNFHLIDINWSAFPDLYEGLVP